MFENVIEGGIRFSFPCITVHIKNANKVINMLSKMFFDAILGVFFLLNSSYPKGQIIKVKLTVFSRNKLVYHEQLCQGIPLRIGKS